MSAPRPLVRVETFAHGPASEVFPRLWGELSSSLLQRGWEIEGKAHGKVRFPGSDSVPVALGHVEIWRPPAEVVVLWPRRSGETGPPSRLRIRCRSEGTGTRVLVEHSGGSGIRGEPRDEQDLGWFAGEVLGPILGATAPARLIAWSDDRVGRRPSGPTSRATYETPVYHLPGFRAILDGLPLGADDRLLEVGCGGGALLKMALASGCSAAAIDHSVDMLKVAAAQNARAISAGRLRLRYGDATALPFRSREFTCAVMSGVLPWLPDPAAAFREVLRTLRPGGRFVALSATPKAYGTPAGGPKRRGGVRFYTDREFAHLATEAGFREVTIEHPDLRAIAREVGVPRNAWYLFAPGYGHVLRARRGGTASGRR